MFYVLRDVKRSWILFVCAGLAALYTYLKTLPLSELFRYPPSMIRDVERNCGIKGLFETYKDFKKYA